MLGAADQAKRRASRRPALRADVVGQWCAANLSAAPAEILFETGYLSQVIGLQLNDGRRVVLKVRDWQDRLLSCSRVQQRPFQLGYPAPELIIRPVRLKGYAVSVETLVEGGGRLLSHPRAAELFSAGLHQLISHASSFEDLGSFEPSPPWVGWDHAGTALWPLPDDRDGDLNAHDAGDWLDQLATAVRTRLTSFTAYRVVGHGDWYSQNVDWVGDNLLAVHDWDSIVSQPEAAIVGQASAIWPATGGPGEAASIEQTERFLEGYSNARGQAWSRDETEVAWAAGLWNRAFDAKKASLVGDSTDLILTRSEAAERVRRAGL